MSDRCGTNAVDVSTQNYLALFTFFGSAFISVFLPFLFTNEIVAQTEEDRESYVNHASQESFTDHTKFTTSIDE